MSNQTLGWSHPDIQLSPGAGICYGVRYVGCLEIKEAMKALNFETRTAVARESIRRVAEAAGLRNTIKRKEVDYQVGKFLGDSPHLGYAGCNVNFIITTNNINIIIMESGETIVCHPMHDVSFACGGDVEIKDFVSYVAKCPEYGRACHVLECGEGLAENIISTIGCAFQLRIKQYLKKHTQVEGSSRHYNSEIEDDIVEGKGNYYNDNPHAAPPEHEFTADVMSLATPPPPQPNSPRKIHDSKSDKYVNEELPKNQFPGINKILTVDLPPAQTSSSLIPSKNETDLQDSKYAVSTDTLEPVFEEWYHGTLSRKQSEALLEFDGDFLVRKSELVGKSSNNLVGQFVLSGKQTGGIKHLLLVDPEGIVRTRDFIFDSVSHLINYHRNNNLPIAAHGSELFLLRPVKKGISSI